MGEKTVPDIRPPKRALMAKSRASTTLAARIRTVAIHRPGCRRRRRSSGKCRQYLTVIGGPVVAPVDDVLERPFVEMEAGAPVRGSFHPRSAS
jgi:hypothetical protein